LLDVVSVVVPPAMAKRVVGAEAEETLELVAGGVPVEDRPVESAFAAARSMMRRSY
jgi:hypothetical protein